jgi:hypothetical protein
VDNGSYDPDGDPITLSQTPPGPYPLGETMVTLTAVDIWGVSNSCLASVRVVDQTPPTIFAPAAVLATNDFNQCGAVVSFPFPTAVDDCSGVTVGCVPPPGSFFPVGTTPVHVTASDAANNVTNYWFNVVVRDTQPPTLTCPNNISVTNAHAAWTSIVTFNPTATDNCPGVRQPVCTPASGSTFGLGDTTVTCAAVDAAGNVSHCTFTVTVHPGNVPPVPIIQVSPLAKFPGYTNLIVVAPEGSSASVVLDGSKSYDVDDTNFLFYWYEGTNLLSTNAVARENLDIGTHEITLWLDDTFPLGTNAASVTLEIITPAQGVALVLGVLDDANLGGHNRQPLLASLKAAAASFDRGDNTAGCNQLRAFQDKVRAQLAPAQPDLAGRLISAAQVIIDAVSPGASRMPRNRGG